jgi:antitoxin (DNA-binding transcriptional repressor) of toxin-antitoxin stability system
MNKQKINISDLQNDWTRFINQIMQGDEVILTKVDKPIAIVSPFRFQKPAQSHQKEKTKRDDFSEEMIEKSSTTSEWWLG